MTLTPAPSPIPSSTPSTTTPTPTRPAVEDGTSNPAPPTGGRFTGLRPSIPTNRHASDPAATNPAPTALKEIADLDDDGVPTAEGRSQLDSKIQGKRNAHSKSPGAPNGDHLDDWLFGLTIREIHDLVPAPASVVEIGAGRSRRLELHLASSACQYVAVDASQEAIDYRQSAGSNVREALLAPAHELHALADNEFDLSFSLGVLSWLTDDSRRQMAVVEQARVARRSLWLNLDWSVAEGGPAFNRMRDMVTAALRPLGFNPYYGLLQNHEIALALKAHITSPAQVQTRLVTYDSGDFPQVMGAFGRRVFGGLVGTAKHQVDRLVDAVDRELIAGIPYRLPDLRASFYVGDDA